MTAAKQSEAWLTAGGRWVKVTQFKAGDQVKAYPGGLQTIAAIEELGTAMFAAITCENQRYVLAGIFGHKITL